MKKTINLRKSVTPKIIYNGLLHTLCAITICSSAKAADIYGLYNQQIGLSKWFLGLNQISNPGVDVVVIGDSILNIGCTSVYQNSFPHLLKVGLQSKLNPPGVLGGYGFLASSFGGSASTYQGGSADNLTPLFLNQSLSSSDDFSNWLATPPGEGTGLRHLGLSGGSNLAVTFRTLGVNKDASERRYFLTGFQPIYRTYPKGGMLNIDVSNTTVPARGTGVIRSMISTHSLSSQFGVHGSIIQTTNRALNWYISVRGDVNTSANKEYLDGMILYDGDERAGVRLHNIGTSGGRIDLWNENSLFASINRWGTGVAGSNVKLFIISNLIQEVQDGAMTMDSYEKFLTARMVRMLNLPSRPSVIVIVPKMPVSFVGQYTEQRFRTFRQKILRISSLLNTCVIDLDAYSQGNFTNQSYSAYTSDIHFNDAGHQMAAWALTHVLTTTVNQQE